MRDFSSILGTLLLALTVSFGVPTTASADHRYPSGPDVSIQFNFRGNDRVCCKRGWHDWWSTWRQCRRAGGYAVRNRECRDDRYGYRDRDYRHNYRYDNGYGYGYGGDPYGRPDRRVCCKRGYSDWWSSWRECRRAGGYETANRECRN